MGINDTILTQNKFLSQHVELLTQQISKFPQQIKEMQKTPNKHQQVTSYELCKEDHPTNFYPPIGEEVNYMVNPNQNQGYQPRKAPYQNNQGYQQRGNNQGYQQGWRKEVGPSYHQNPYQNYSQPPQH